VWPNFNEYMNRMMSGCEAANVLFPHVGVAACRVQVQQYFGQLFAGGYSAWIGSRAAEDVRSSRNGQDCKILAKEKEDNRC
jgi:hypothetical protein